MIRIGSTQPRSRMIDWRLKPAEVLEQVDKSLEELTVLAHRAGEAGCDVVVFPEDTTGTLLWEMGNKSALEEVLPEATRRMLERLGAAAASHNMYLVCSNDTIEADGTYRNTAFFVGRDGVEIGRYYKVNMPLHESDKVRGSGFPVYETPDLGGVGMLICYDMVFPEAPRCLALGGADIIFYPTMGGAAIGDEDIARAAIRTRAVENFVYLVASQRGRGSMIVSPQGKILVEAQEPDDIAIADIEPLAGRTGGDSTNHQDDMRARLFRERLPAAFDILTDLHPPALKKVPEALTVQEAVRIAEKLFTTGGERFRDADALLRDGKVEDAVHAFENLGVEFPRTWVHRMAQERLAKIRAATEESASSA